MAQKISRREFLKLASGTSLFGLGVLASGCASEQKDEGGDGWMPDQYQGRGDFPAHLKGRVAISPKNPSIMRDDEKCILCGQCIEACHNVIGVHGYYPLPLKDETACIGCGQCTMWCPTGAIHERPAVDQVEAALDDDSKFVVVQTAPATKVSLGEEFGMAPGSIVGGKQVAALRALGFDAVFDTCMSADMTIMEEASEALVRLTQKKDVLPHFTSCCPGWVRFCELFYPDLMKHLSTCKSPAAMMGATVKSYYAEKKGLDPKNIVTVSIMPCTAKKGEALRKELGHDDMQDVDYVLTTRELARDRAHAVRVAVHHIVAGETVDVGIDETGGDDGIAQIENLDTLGSLVTPCTEASILDGQVPALCETVGQHESPCFDGICAHGSSPSTNPIDSDCTYQPVSLRGQLPPHRKPADVSQERIPAQIEAMAYTDKQDTPCFMQLFAQSYRPMGAI